MESNPPIPLSDLIKSCLANDRRAQEQLYRWLSPRLFAVCLRYAADREAAEDVLQEGFIKVFSQISKFEKRGSLEGWILRIIVHTCINHLKKNKKFNDNVDLAYAGNMVIREDYIPSIIQAKQIVETIRTLPIGYRTVLNLYAIEGYSHKEIGQLLDIEESTSRSQYTRAKTMLEEMLLNKRIIQQPKEKKKWFSPVRIV